MQVRLDGALADPNIAMMNGAEKRPAANIATMSAGTDPASGTAMSGMP